jgi:hypothetical protein
MFGNMKGTKATRPAVDFCYGTIIISAASAVTFALLGPGYFHIYESAMESSASAKMVLLVIALATMLSVQVAVLWFVGRWCLRGRRLSGGMRRAQVLIGFITGGAVDFVVYNVWMFLTFTF